MMGYGYGWMGGGGFGLINELVWLVVGILLIIWLWKNITK